MSPNPSLSMTICGCTAVGRTWRGSSVMSSALGTTSERKPQRKSVIAALRRVAGNVVLSILIPFQANSDPRGYSIDRYIYIYIYTKTFFKILSPFRLLEADSQACRTHGRCAPQLNRSISRPRPIQADIRIHLQFFSLREPRELLPIFLRGCE